MPSTRSGRAFLDAGVFIGALMRGDSRHAEAHRLVEQARTGALPACTSASVLCEVYAALTWSGAVPPRSPGDAAAAVGRLIDAPSNIVVLQDGEAAALLALDLASAHGLTARRIHDARHAATALSSGIASVYTYDPTDWAVFASDGIAIEGPPSTVERVGRPTAP